MNDDSTISPIMKKRLDSALTLINDLHIDKVLCTGGFGLHSKTLICEADAMEDYLLKHNINKDMILKENNSKTTKENMKLSKKIIESYKNVEVILLTSTYHVARSYLNPLKLFKKEMPNIKVTIIGVE